MVEEAIFVHADDTVLLKKAVAKSLYAKNFAQSKISEILKLSQPMVSNYCSSNDTIPNNIKDLAEKISEKIIDGNSVTFQTGVSFVDRFLEGEFYIAQKNEIISEENIKIIDNLTEAFLLLKDQDISGLIPEVKINIAMAKEKAKSSEDVAAFLNGLIIAEDRVTSNNGVRFGRSKHLSSLILSLRDVIDVNAIMNVAYIKNLEKTNFSYTYLTKDFKLENNKKNVDILLHKGDFGIEPCAYVLGKDAMNVVNKVLKIKEEIK